MLSSESQNSQAGVPQHQNTVRKWKGTVPSTENNSRGWKRRAQSAPSPSSQPPQQTGLNPVAELRNSLFLGLPALCGVKRGTNPEKKRV